MHELSIAVALLDAAQAEARSHHAERIVRLKCRVGAARQIMPDLLQDAFAVAREGSLAAGAVLDVETVGMTLKCRACGTQQELQGWQFTCPACGSEQVELSGGDMLELSSIELEVPGD